MKVKKLIILFVLCIVLTGCSKKASTNEQNQISPTKLPKVTAITIPTELPKVTAITIPTELPAITIIPTPTELPAPTFDYSGHTDANESSYITKLADLSKLIEGKSAFAQEELMADWKFTFQGFETKDQTWGYDARSCDISGEDLNVVDNINDLTFDTNTIWPEKLPDGFDPDKILEYNKNPGLNIRSLQEQGITGEGVGIAIIDTALPLSHEQYKNNLMLYERIHCDDPVASMHGPAVASIAVGKDIGVAPGAKLYYIASTFGHDGNADFNLDTSIMADAILRVLEINENLPDNEKIRVISISCGYGRFAEGYEEIAAAIKKADERNVFVITTSTEEYYKDFSLWGMDRDYIDDPDKITSFQPASWLARTFYADPSFFQDDIGVPIGSRTIAEPTGDDDYSIARNGGMSWAVPWCAGFYALCCQVKPDITPQEFIELVNSTAVTTDIEHDGKTYQLGKIINPAGVIEELQKDN